MVLDLYKQGKLTEISEYCRCDVLDTYFVFLRLQVLMGRITSQAEAELILQTRRMLEEQADKHLGYRTYLQAWEQTGTPTAL